MKTHVVKEIQSHTRTHTHTMRYITGNLRRWQFGWGLLMADICFQIREDDIRDVHGRDCQTCPWASRHGRSHLSRGRQRLLFIREGQILHQIRLGNRKVSSLILTFLSVLVVILCKTSHLCKELILLWWLSEQSLTHILLIMLQRPWRIFPQHQTGPWRDWCGELHDRRL